MRGAEDDGVSLGMFYKSSPLLLMLSARWDWVVTAHLRNPYVATISICRSNEKEKDVTKEFLLYACSSMPFTTYLYLLTIEGGREGMPQLKTESEDAACICCRDDKLKLKWSGWKCCLRMGAGVDTSRSSEDEDGLKRSDLFSHQ